MEMGAREVLEQAGWWGLVVCAGLSLWPFRLARRWKSWTLYLPVASLVGYGLYERARPEEIGGGGQTAAVLALLLFLWINGMAKVLWLAWLQQKAGGSRRRWRAQPQRLGQVLLAVPVAAGCALWWWMTRT